MSDSEKDEAAALAEAKAEQIARYTEGQAEVGRRLSGELVERFRGLMEKKDVPAHTVCTALMGAACTLAGDYLTRAEFTEWLDNLAAAHATISNRRQDLN